MAGYSCCKGEKRWIIVVAVLFFEIVHGLTNYAMPYLYRELIKRFGESATVTSGPFSLYNGLAYVLGKFLHCLTTEVKRKITTGNHFWFLSAKQNTSIRCKKPIE